MEAVPPFRTCCVCDGADIRASDLVPLSDNYSIRCAVLCLLLHDGQLPLLEARLLKTGTRLWYCREHLIQIGTRMSFGRSISEYFRKSIDASAKLLKISPISVDLMMQIGDEAKAEIDNVCPTLVAREDAYTCVKDSPMSLELKCCVCDEPNSPASGPWPISDDRALRCSVICILLHTDLLNKPKAQQLINCHSRLWYCRKHLIQMVKRMNFCGTLPKVMIDYQQTLFKYTVLLKIPLPTFEHLIRIYNEAMHANAKYPETVDLGAQSRVDIHHPPVIRPIVAQAPLLEYCCVCATRPTTPGNLLLPIPKSDFLRCALFCLLQLECHIPMSTSGELIKNKFPMFFCREHLIDIGTRIDFGRNITNCYRTRVDTLALVLNIPSPSSATIKRIGNWAQEVDNVIKQIRPANRVRFIIKRRGCSDEKLPEKGISLTESNSALEKMPILIPTTRPRVMVFHPNSISKKIVIVPAKTIQINIDDSSEVHKFDKAKVKPVTNCPRTNSQTPAQLIDSDEGLQKLQERMILPPKKCRPRSRAIDRYAIGKRIIKIAAKPVQSNVSCSSEAHKFDQAQVEPITKRPRTNRQTAQLMRGFICCVCHTLGSKKAWKTLSQSHNDRATMACLFFDAGLIERDDAPTFLPQYIGRRYCTAHLLELNDHLEEMGWSDEEWYSRVVAHAGILLVDTPTMDNLTAVLNDARAAKHIFSDSSSIGNVLSNGSTPEADDDTLGWSRILPAAFAPLDASTKARMTLNQVSTSPATPLTTKSAVCIDDDIVYLKSVPALFPTDK